MPRSRRKSSRSYISRPRKSWCSPRRVLPDVFDCHRLLTHPLSVDLHQALRDLLPKGRRLAPGVTVRGARATSERVAVSRLGVTWSGRASKVDVPFVIDQRSFMRALEQARAELFAATTKVENAKSGYGTPALPLSGRLRSDRVLVPFHNFALNWLAYRHNRPRRAIPLGLILAWALISSNGGEDRCGTRSPRSRGPGVRSARRVVPSAPICTPENPDHPPTLN